MCTNGLLQGHPGSFITKVSGNFGNFSVFDSSIFDSSILLMILMVLMVLVHLLNDRHNSHYRLRIGVRDVFSRCWQLVESALCDRSNAGDDWSRSGGGRTLGRRYRNTPTPVDTSTSQTWRSMRLLSSGGIRRQWRGCIHRGGSGLPMAGLRSTPLSRQMPHLCLQ